MEKDTYKIVVLSDLKDTIKNTLKSTVSLAKMINGEIEVFSVKKPIDIVGKDNQLSAMRSINSEHTRTEKKMKAIIDPIAKDYGVDIKYSFAFGNVKNEITRFIKEHQPDLIVLGKRKSRPIALMGDSITKYVLDTFKGTVMIAADKNVLEPEKGVSLGILNDSEPPVGLAFVNQLMVHSQMPFKSFNFVKGISNTQEKQAPSNKKNVEYTFEHNDDTISNLSNYLSQNRINLLCVNRAKKNTKDKAYLTPSEIKQVVSKINTNVLVTG